MSELVVDPVSMGAASNMAHWCDFGWHLVAGCTRVSPGCENCSAETVSAMDSHPGRPFHGVAQSTPRGARWTGTIRVEEYQLETPSLWQMKGKRIFVCPMSDLFHDAVPDAFIARVFETIRAYDQYTYLILTKRAERASKWGEKFPKHAWLGMSVEDQERAEERLPYLLRSGALNRWVNCEPLLEHVDLSPWLPRLDWVSAGPEVGENARPVEVEWFRSLRDQCLRFNVPFFLKGATLDGKRHHDVGV